MILSTAIGRNRPFAIVQIRTDGRPQCAKTGRSPTACRTGHTDPERVFPVGPCTDAKRQRTAFPERLAERLLAVGDENEMNVVGHSGNRQKTATAAFAAKVTKT